MENKEGISGLKLRVEDARELNEFLVQFWYEARQHTDAHAIAKTACRLVVEKLRVDRAYWAELDWITRDYVIGAAFHVPDASVIEGRFPLDAWEPFTSCHLAGTPVVVNDTQTDPRISVDVKAGYLQIEVGADLATPVIAGGQLRCTLAVNQRLSREWTPLEVKLVEGIAQWCWAEVERARAEDALRESEANFATDLANAERLRVLAERLVTEDRFETIYEELLSATIAIARSDAGTVQIYDPETKSLELIASRSLSPVVTDYFARVDASSNTACGIALRTGQRTITDYEADEKNYGCLLHFQTGIQSAIAVPLISRTGAPLGMLNAHWREPRHRPTVSEDRFLHLIARQAADLIEQRRAQRVLRESEQNLRGVANIVPDLLWYSEADGSTPWFNDRYLEYTGQMLDQAKGWGWVDAIHPEDRAASAERYRRAVEQSRPLQQEHRLRRHTGEYRWFRVGSEPVTDQQGRVTRMYGAATDIHDQRIAMEALRKSEERFRGSLAEKEELLKEVHHRVKNNLQVIVSLLNMQTHQIEDPSVLSQFQEARNRVLAIASIHELLYRAKSLAGIVLTDYARQLAPSLVDFYGLGSRVTVTVEGDGNSLELERAVSFGMLLNELISNACKHAFPDPAAGNILVRIEPEGESIVLTVADNGKGLPKGFRYQNATSLGLKLVHTLARQLRGNVEISSTGGTTFRVTFPAMVTETKA